MKAGRQSSNECETVAVSCARAVWPHSLWIDCARTLNSVWASKALVTLAVERAVITIRRAFPQRVWRPFTSRERLTLVGRGWLKSALDSSLPGALSVLHGI